MEELHQLLRQRHFTTNPTRVNIGEMDPSRDRGVLGATVDHALRGDGLRASRSFNLCESLTVLLGSDAEAAARARIRHRSSNLALV